MSSVEQQRDAALEAAAHLAEKLRVARAMLRRVSNAVNEGAIYQSDPVIADLRKLLPEIADLEPGFHQGKDRL